VGDLFLQRHLFLLPAEAPAGVYTLYTGAYWLDSLERWPVVQDGETIGDRLPLPTVMVEP
jgi:hypothetical protein